MRRGIILAAGIGFLLISWVSLDQYAQARAESPLKWKALVPDFSRLELAAFHPQIISPQIIFYKTSLKNLKLEVVSARDFGSQRTSAKKVSESTGAILSLNANFFDTSGKPLGLVVSRGLILSKVHRGGGTLSGIFIIDSEGPRIIHRSAFKPAGVVSAVQAGPRLLVDGKTTKLKNAGIRANRAGICIDSEKNIVVFVSGTWPVPPSFTELQQALLKIGCRDALNLDGGGSRQLEVQAGEDEFSESIVGKDEVPVFLILRKR